MAYSKTTDFASKDSLLTGDPAKIVKGTEIDAEFDNIEAAFDDLGTMAGQAASAVAVTGGTIDGATVGGTTPAAGTFTNVKVGNGGSNYFIGIPNDSYYMRIHGSNAVNQGAGVILFGGTHETAPNVGRLVYGSTTALQWNGSGVITAAGVYSNTSASAANVFVDSSGVLYRSTSSQKYKEDVRPLGTVDVDLFQPVRYKSKKRDTDGDRDYLGFIAEDLHAAGLGDVVQYDSEGEPDGVMYERIVVVLMAEIQALRQRVAALEAP